MRPRWLVLFPLLAVLAVGCKSEVPWEPVPHVTSAQGADGLDEEELLEPSKLSAGRSLGVVALVDVSMVALLIGALALARVHRRRARSEAALDRLVPLTDGPATVAGVVELEVNDGRPAIEVRIRQQGTEACNKGNWSHAWTEIGREVYARPFFVRRDDGARVRVEPVVGRVALHDTLSRITHDGATHRLHIAELTTGERVFVSGTLSGGQPDGWKLPYRTAGAMPVLRAPALGKLLASTEPPGGTSASRAGFHRVWAAALVVVVAAVSAFVLPAYRVLTLFGEPVAAQAVATRTWRVWVKPKNGAGYWVHHWAVQGRLARDLGGGSVDDECSPAFYASVRDGQVTRLPFVLPRAMPSFAELGTSPTLGRGRAGILAAVLVILLIAYPASAFATRPWYAKRKVSESGPGRLVA